MHLLPKSLKNRGWHLSLLLLAGGLLALGVSWWRQRLTPLASALPQDPLIQVYFNQSQAEVYREPYRKRSRLGNDLEHVILDGIASAQSSIDVAAHELNLPRVAQALAKRKEEGLTVRVIMEHDYNQLRAVNKPQDERSRGKQREYTQLADRNQDGMVTGDEAAVSDGVLILKNAQIPVLDDTMDGSEGSGLMHHKFMIVDRRTLIVGSANFTLSDIHGDFLAPDSRGNANHLFRINSAALARIFQQEFDLMWGDGPGGAANSLFGLSKPYRPAQTIAIAPGSNITVQFSPTSRTYPWEYSVNGLIGRMLNTSTRSVHLALFVFSDQTLSNILEGIHHRGGKVRALIDPGFAYRNYSEALDMMGVALTSDRCTLETHNRPWQRAIATVGIPALSEGDLLHHKFGVVDGHRVITGSQNWSEAANGLNDENLLVIDNRTVAAHFEREFDRLYTHATLGVPAWLQKKMQQQNQRCR